MGDKLEEWPRLEHIGNLMVYFSEYGILVCKSCEFAIQPNAIDAHLLRHHIYREQRQRLLERIRRLSLLQPQNVQYPGTPPIALPHLPVAAGHQCRVGECGHLCSSIKRMSQHLREQHGPVSVYTVHESSSAVHLQTFFRGNQIRYFKVTTTGYAEPAATSLTQKQKRPLQYDALFPIVLEEQPTLSKATLQDLMYLHHYTTVAGVALTRGTEPASFWTHDLPLHAVEHTFLMHGMLGLAAYHLALCAAESDPDVARVHRDACLRHQSVGLRMFRTLVANPAAGTHMPLMAFARLLGTQHGVHSMLKVGHEADPSPLGVGPLPDLSPVREFMNMLRGGLNLYLDLQPLLPSDSLLRISTDVSQGLDELEIPLDEISVSNVSRINQLGTRLRLPGSASHLSTDQRSLILADCSEVAQLVKLCLESFAIEDPTTITPTWVTDRLSISMSETLMWQAENIATELAELGKFTIIPTTSTLTTPCPVLLCYPKIPPAIYVRLSSLPSQLAAELPALQGPDLQAFDQAMAILVSCYARNYAADAAWARWNGIESWTKLLPSHFHNMIESGSPWALVLVAHWCILIAGQEHDYWHLYGHSRRLLKNLLSNLDPVVQDLVHNCIDPLLALL